MTPDSSAACNSMEVVERKDYLTSLFTDNYAEPIVENGLLCRDMVVLKRDL